MSNLVYPFASEYEFYLKNIKFNYSKYIVSINYDKPSASFGLWGKIYHNTWIRIGEYCYNCKKQGYELSDSQMYALLEKLINERNVDIVVNDDAKTFISFLKKHSKYKIIPIQKNIYIQETSKVLQNGNIKIFDNCFDTKRELAQYSYNDLSNILANEIEMFVEYISQNNFYEISNDKFCSVDYKMPEPHTTVLIKLKDESDGITGNDHKTFDLSYIREGDMFICTAGSYHKDKVESWVSLPLED